MVYGQGASRTGTGGGGSHSGTWARGVRDPQERESLPGAGEAGSALPRALPSLRWGRVEWKFGEPWAALRPPGFEAVQELVSRRAVADTSQAA